MHLIYFLLSSKLLFAVKIFLIKHSRMFTNKVCFNEKGIYKKE